MTEADVQCGLCSDQGRALQVFERLLMILVNQTERFEKQSVFSIFWQPGCFIASDTGHSKSFSTSKYVSPKYLSSCILNKKAAANSSFGSPWIPPEQKKNHRGMICKLGSSEERLHDTPWQINI